MNLPIPSKVLYGMMRNGRIRPHNTASGGVCYTLNTRYEDAAVSDYTHAKHAKTCVMVTYETE